VKPGGYVMAGDGTFKAFASKAELEIWLAASGYRLGDMIPYEDGSVSERWDRFRVEGSEGG